MTSSQKSNDYKCKIFGIDPGSRTTGFACIGSEKKIPLCPQDFKILDIGVIKLDPKRSHIERIGLLHAALFELISYQNPTTCVIEKEFAGINPLTSLKLGETRGSLLAAVHRLSIPIIEITPAQIKRIIGGGGRASKEDVAFALKNLLRFERKGLPLDATDALAAALSYGLTISTTSRLVR